MILEICLALKIEFAALLVDSMETHIARAERAHMIKPARASI